MFESSDDLILALPVFPSWKWEDNIQELRRLLCKWCPGIWGCANMHRDVDGVKSNRPLYVVYKHISCYTFPFFLRLDIINKSSLLLPPFQPSVLAYQQPNAKKLRRIAEKAEQLAAKGVVPRRQKQLLNRRSVNKTAKKAVTEANNYPDREYYNIWGQERECHACFCVQWWSHPCTPSISCMGMWRLTRCSDDCCVNSHLGSEDKRMQEKV